MKKTTIFNLKQPTIKNLLVIALYFTSFKLKILNGPLSLKEPLKKAGILHVFLKKNLEMLHLLFS